MEEKYEVGKPLTDEEVEMESAAAYRELDKTEEQAVEQTAEELAKEVEALRLLEIALRGQRRRDTKAMFHSPTPAHSDKQRGVGITRKSKVKTPAKRKSSKKSRKINRGR